MENRKLFYRGVILQAQFLPGNPPFFKKKVVCIKCRVRLKRLKVMLISCYTKVFVFKYLDFYSLPVFIDYLLTECMEIYMTYT